MGVFDKVQEKPKVEEPKLGPNQLELKRLADKIEATRNGLDHSDIPLNSDYYKLREQYAPSMHKLVELIKEGKL